MDKNYIELFKEIARATELAAERGMQYDNNLKDNEGYKTAEVMREDYRALHERLSNDNIDTIERQDYIKLLLGSMIVTQNLEDMVTKQQTTIKAYKNFITPKLQRIMDETKTNEEANALAQKLFITKDEKINN